MRTAEEKLAWNKYMREYRIKRSAGKKAAEAATKREWLDNNPDKHRESSLRSARKVRHGLSVESYKARLEMQNNLCRLCDQEFTKDDGPVLDHNHETLQFRDFIHRTCNLALGNLKDSPDLCRKAAEYLERHIP